MADNAKVDHRFDRMEENIHELNKAVVLLARIEERLVFHTDRVDWLGKKMESLEKRLRVVELSRAKLIGAVTVLGGLGSFAGSYLLSLVG